MTTTGYGELTRQSTQTKNQINKEDIKKKVMQAYPKVMDRLRTIENSSKYKELSPENKTKFRSYLYDKYMVASYKARGLTPPSKDSWVNKSFTPPDNRMERGTGYAMSATKGIGEVGEGLLSFSQWINNKVSPITVKHGGTLETARALGNDTLESAKAPFKWLENRSDAYLADHPAQGIIESALRFASTEAPKLPLYHGVGTIVNSATKATGVEELFNTGKIAPKVLGMIKGASEGYLIGHSLGENEQQSRSDAATFAALGLPSVGYASAKVGIGKIVPQISKLFSKLNTVGGRPLVEFAIDEGVNIAAENKRLGTLPKAISGTPQHLTPTNVRTKLGQAGFQVLNDISKAYYGKLYQFLKSNEREQVYKEIEKHLNHSIETSVSDNVGKTAMIVKENIEQQNKTNPFFNKMNQSFQKIGIDSAKLNTEEVVEHNAAITGKKSIPKVIKRLTSGTVETSFEKEENRANAYAKTIAETVGSEAPGAAHYQSPEFQSNLLKLIRTNMHLESVQHQVTFLYGIRNEFPKPIKVTIENMMQRNFPSKNGFNSHDYAKMVQNLEKHMADVTKGIQHDRPEITKHGGRVFRSTVVTPNKPKTRWQKDVELIRKEIGDHE